MTFAVRLASDRWQFRWATTLLQNGGDVTATGQVIEGGAGVQSDIAGPSGDEFAAQVRSGLWHQEHRCWQRHAGRIVGEDR